MLFNALFSIKPRSNGRYITFVLSGVFSSAIFWPVSVIVETIRFAEGNFSLSLFSKGIAAMTSPTETA